ncbi:MAG: KH domain-containing protein [Candidatus Eremiobacteraeota bacterium]|nr:KH domain-containing protein [Candidatus Eremiobacteraeota bacterium]
MSAFDDEFGLFGEGGEEDERRSTLGARKIASSETIIDDIEPEDERPPRRTSGPSERKREYGNSSGGGRRFAEKRDRPPVDPVAAQARAGELLLFLAKQLVAKPEVVTIESYPADGPEPPVLELMVDPEDLGKVIGRSGRVAQAMRTIVRAAAEGKIAIDIYDTEEENQDVEAVDAGDDAE